MESTSSMQPLPTVSAASNRARRKKFFLPLSEHGMPKTPKSPDGGLRPHRFSGQSAAISPLPTPTPSPMPPMSPMSPPPLSAKSFGTFIDSEPSTPACSPRMGFDNSTLVLLSPVTSNPTSATEPEPRWEMMAPPQKRKRDSSMKKVSLFLSKDVIKGTSLSSHPVKTIPEEPPKEITTPPPLKEKVEEKAPEEQQPEAAPLEKLATKVKLMLRRKSGEKKSGKPEKKKREFELDRVETVHWTEM